MPSLYSYFLVSLLVIIPVVGQAESNSVVAPYAPDFVKLEGRNLTPLSSTESKIFQSASYIILYFGASQCPEGDQIFPVLMSAYNHRNLFAQHYEVLFMSEDKSDTDMFEYMLKKEINWPAMSFYEMTSQTNELKKFYPGNGLPWVTVIDQKGAIILQSKSNQDGADVLKQFLALMAME